MNTREIDRALFNGYKVVESDYINNQKVKLSDNWIFDNIRDEYNAWLADFFGYHERKVIISDTDKLIICDPGTARTIRRTLDRRLSSQAYVNAAFNAMNYLGG